MLIANVKQKNRANNNCLLVTMADAAEGEVVVELSMDIVVKYRLEKGVDIEDDIIQQIFDEQRIIDIKQTAYSYAVYAPRSRKQIIQRLDAKGFSVEEIDIALAFLVDFYLIDDLLFAKKYISTALLKKKVGKLKIINDLCNRGVAKEIAVEAAKEYFDKNKPMEMALSIAEKKVKLTANKPIQKQKSSLYNHLIAKGFSFYEAKEVINQIYK